MTDDKKKTNKQDEFQVEELESELEDVAGGNCGGCSNCSGCSNSGCSTCGGGDQQIE